MQMLAFSHYDQADPLLLGQAAPAAIARRAGLSGTTADNFH
jgi:hypothetical protein